jgi:hypothetical protein
MDSALSRTMSIFLEDRKRRRGVRSSGFSTPAPMTLERRARELVSEAVNLSQRMNRRSSPNCRLMRSSWRIARAIEVLPIPPTPMRATEVRRSAKPIIFPIHSSRPKKAPGGGGGDSPGMLDASVSKVVDLSVVGIADLVRAYGSSKHLFWDE